mmetsp:Transcript_2467/g.3509  ORF Transcript_2467/g.3509 Transcript_2467/m.3509 type:complete len:210 (-) Transcript_2467:588-1217(-)
MAYRLHLQPGLLNVDRKRHLNHLLPFGVRFKDHGGVGSIFEPGWKGMKGDKQFKNSSFVDDALCIAKGLDEGMRLQLDTDWEVACVAQLHLYFLFQAGLSQRRVVAEIKCKGKVFALVETHLHLPTVGQHLERPGIVVVEAKRESIIHRVLFSAFWTIPDAYVEHLAAQDLTRRTGEIKPAPTLTHFCCIMKQYFARVDDFNCLCALIA